MQEQEMIALLREKNEQGMDALLHHYAPLMRYIIAPILSNQQDREDCLSETAMRIWEHIETFDAQRGSWCAWLTAVTRNTARNYRRGLSHRPDTEELLENAPASELTPEEILLRREREEMIRQALQGLSAQERTLFYRKYYYLQSTAQIASELGLTERAVEGRLYRLKKQLRKRLGGE